MVSFLEEVMHPIDPCHFRRPWITLKGGTGVPIFGRISVCLCRLTNSDQNCRKSNHCYDAYANCQVSPVCIRLSVIICIYIPNTVRVSRLRTSINKNMMCLLHAGTWLESNCTWKNSIAVISIGVFWRPPYATRFVLRQSSFLLVSGPVARCVS